VLAISARSVENPSEVGVEAGSVGEDGVGGGGESGVEEVEEMTGWLVVGRLEAAWGASSRLSVDSPRLRLEAATKREGSSRRGADEGRAEVELGLAATVGEIAEDMTWVMGAARGATTGE
jgi:hypothetical protein